MFKRLKQEDISSAIREMTVCDGANSITIRFANHLQSGVFITSVKIALDGEPTESYCNERIPREYERIVEEVRELLYPD